jgi:hypothetical protein
VYTVKTYLGNTAAKICGRFRKKVSNVLESITGQQWTRTNEEMAMVQQPDFESCSASIDEDQRNIGTFPDHGSLRDGLVAKSRIAHAALENLEMHWR